MSKRRSNPQGKPALSIALGAVVAIVSTTQPWVKIEGPFGEYIAKGLDLNMYFFSTLIAVGTILLAGGLFIDGANGAGRNKAIAAILLCLLVVYPPMKAVLSPVDAFADQFAEELAAQAGTTVDIAKASIRAAHEAGRIDISTQLGAFVGLLGAVAALTGAIVGTIRGLKRDVTDRNPRAQSNEAAGAAER